MKLFDCFQDISKLKKKMLKNNNFHLFLLIEDKIFENDAKNIINEKKERKIMTESLIKTYKCINQYLK